MYVIQWKSKVNGRAGRGTKLFEGEEGAQLVEELNAEYPDIHHELLDSELCRSRSQPASEREQTPPPLEVKAEAEPGIDSQNVILSFKA